MRFQLDATQEEIETQGADLVKAIVDLVDPDGTLDLVKGLPEAEPGLKYPALRGIQSEAKKEYRRLMADMIQKIQAVMERGLEEPVTKSMVFDHTQELADQDGAKYAQIKARMKKKGHGPEEFEEGGRFYGWSVNQLLGYLEKADASNA